MATTPPFTASPLLHVQQIHRNVQWYTIPTGWTQAEPDAELRITYSIYFVTLEVTVPDVYDFSK